MNKIFGAFCALLVLVMASCDPSSSGETIQEQTFPSCFVNVTDIADGTNTVYTQVGYKLTLNYTNNTADLLVSNLRLPDETAYPAMTLKNMPISYDKEGWIIVKGTAVSPEMTGVGNKPLFDSFELRLLGRIAGGSYVPALVMQYTIDGRYSVASSFAGQLLLGKTKSVLVGSDPAQTFETDESSYELLFDFTKKTLKMTINNAKFLDKMPNGMNIVLKDIPFTMSGATAHWNVDAIKPYLADVPQENFPITDMVGNLNFGSGMTMRFTCKPVIKEQPLGEFDVDVDCKFNYIPGAE